MVQHEFEWPGNANIRDGILAEVLSYATFYGLSDTIAQHLQEVAPCPVWEDIAEHPEFYLGMAQELRDEAVWYEALRHIIGSYCFHNEGPCYHYTRIKFRDLQNIDYRNLKLMVLEHRENLQILTSRIFTSLQELVNFPDPQFSCTNRFQGVVRQTFLGR